MIAFEKFHGTGNEFFVVDATEPVTDRRRLATALCDRDTGLRVADSVGADGILFLALEDGYASPRVVMTLVQPDGSTAPMCGNGARCAAAWAARRTDADVVMVDTQAGTRRATVGEDTVTIEMGRANFAPAAVPVAGDEPVLEASIEGQTVTAVDTGVPHAVAFVDDVSTTDLASLAPPVRHADAFPRGANVTLASPCKNGFDQRTYERGVEGETRSCGTGAVAIAAVARKLGLTGNESVSVHPPGSRLDIRFTSRGALLTGPTEQEFEGHVSMDPSPTVEIDGKTEAAGD
jgi:diaminopimelate epimerase